MLRTQLIIVLIAIWIQNSLQNKIPLTTYDTEQDWDQIYKKTPHLPDQKIIMEKDLIDDGDGLMTLGSGHNQDNVTLSPRTEIKTYVPEDSYRRRYVQNVIDQILLENARRRRPPHWPPYRPRPYNNKKVLLSHKNKKDKLSNRPHRPPKRPKKDRKEESKTDSRETVWIKLKRRPGWPSFPIFWPSFEF